MPSGIFGRTVGPPPGSIRPCRRVYCGNVMPHISEIALRKFLNDIITNVPERPKDWPRESIAGVVMKREKNFAFVDFFAGEDADVAMQLDGIDFDPHTQLKFRRTKEYVETNPPAKHCKYCLCKFHALRGPYRSLYHFSYVNIAILVAEIDG